MAMQSDLDSFSEINITPFVDVVLVLLVIFMVTAPMMVQNAMKVDLPSSKSIDSVEPDTMSIGITKLGQYLINGELTTIEQLQTVAQNRFKQNPKVQVIFAADLDSRHEATVMAMDRIRRAGITRFAFQVVKQE